MGWFIAILVVNVIMITCNIIAIILCPFSELQDLPAIKEWTDTVIHFVTFLDTVTMQGIIFAVAKNEHDRMVMRRNKKKKV